MNNNNQHSNEHSQQNNHVLQLPHAISGLQNSFQAPTFVYVNQPNEVYPRYASVISFDTTTCLYALRDELTGDKFCDPLQRCNVVMPAEPFYHPFTATKNLSWLSSNLYRILSEIHAIQKQKHQSPFEQHKQRNILFHRKVHASLLFENINSITGCEMSDQPRQYNCALVCSLHDVVLKHSLFDNDLYLLGKNKKNHTMETTLKKFCLATIAFRMATGRTGKINTTIRCIRDLQFVNESCYHRALNFVTFFSHKFNTEYTETFKCINKRLETYDIYKTRTNLTKKNKTPLYNHEAPKDGALHYKHFLLYDNLSSAFQIAFLNNAFNVKGIPASCNNYSREERFPLLTKDQKADMLQRNTQLWHIFQTDW